MKKIKVVRAICFFSIIIVLFSNYSVVAQQSLNTSLVSKWFITDANPENVTVSGNYVFIGDPYFGVRIINISDINNPVQIATFENASYGGANDIEVIGNVAYVGFGEGLAAIDVTDPSNPNELGFIATSDWALRLEIRNNVAFIAAYLKGLLIIDVTDPANMQQIGSINPIAPSGFTVDVDVQGNYAYLACKTNGLRVIDISNPSNPQEVGFYTMGVDALDAECYGDYTFVGDDNDLFRVFNVSNVSNITEVANVNIEDDGADIEVVGYYAYVAAVYGGLRIINVTVPNNPVEIGYYKPVPRSFPSSAYAVDVKDNLAFVGFWEDSLFIIRNTLVSGINPANSSQLNSFTLYQNYPNPFNPNTSIWFSIPQRSFVTLEVFDALGKRVEVLVSEELEIGNYSYDWNAQDISSGIYLYRINAGSFSQIKKMILLK